MGVAPEAVGVPVELAVEHLDAVCVSVELPGPRRALLVELVHDSGGASRFDDEVVVVAGVEGRGLADRLEAADALRPVGRFARPVERRQQERGEDCDDCNYDQQFDQGEETSFHFAGSPVKYLGTVHHGMFHSRFFRSPARMIRERRVSSLAGVRSP